MTAPFDQDDAGPADPEPVGGPLRPRTAPGFAGRERRPVGAGLVAALGAVAWLVAPFLAWARYDPPVVDTVVTGWRDAAGSLGDGWIVAGLAAVALVAAERSLTGRAGPGTRPVLWVASLTAVTVVVLTWWQLGRAAAELTARVGADVDVRPGPGLLAVLAGAVAVALAGRLHETDPDRPVPQRGRTRPRRLLRSPSSGAVSSVG